MLLNDGWGEAPTAMRALHAAGLLRSTLLKEHALKAGIGCCSAEKDAVVAGRSWTIEPGLFPPFKIWTGTADDNV